MKPTSLIILLLALGLISCNPQESGTDIDSDETVEVLEGPRDVQNWPFAQKSFWNMPIGSGAQYHPQPIDPKHISGTYADLDIIILTPEALKMDVYGTKYRWQDGTNQKTRCKKFNDTVHLRLPVPEGYVTHFLGTKPNNPAVVMQPDGRTLVQTQPFQACEGGYATTGLKMPGGEPVNEILRAPDVDIYGEGRAGMHGGPV
jgi:heme/copper-type cytochrome/quinol oxidase subunit 2